MAYSIYQTDCVVLGIREIQEHDLMLRVFSPVFGYMRIIAKGTRKNSSKLRANIQEYAVSHVAIVKGKDFFILTDIRNTFSFIQSRSVVYFLKHIEGLFFDDENDHGAQINEDIYTMLLTMCKLIVWMVSEKKDKGTLVADMVLIEDFFTVYVKGLQGFGEKLHVEMNIEKGMMSQNLYECILTRKNQIETMKTKLAL